MESGEGGVRGLSVLTLAASGSSRLNEQGWGVVGVG